MAIFPPLRRKSQDESKPVSADQLSQRKNQEPVSSPPEKAKTEGKNMSNAADFTRVVDECFENLQIERPIKDVIKKTLMLNFNEQISTSKLKDRLQILFEYERNYLSLIKEFKEEIKFVGSLQEDLRKERAKFFSDTLQDVSAALKDSQVSNEVANQWIQELVNSYTKSLDVSSGLIEEHTFDAIGEIRRQAKSQLKTVAD